jgi:hypothetical protein
VAEQWVCVFDGRAGSRAPAIFASEEQARQFAERHAQAMTTTGTALKWSDTNHSAVLTTLLGKHWIVRISKD